ncbi:MAG: VanZ family protein [Lachnospiraceae bacterium]|nr:VanZ family protein [Lachnospiraceae bacterium]
MQDSKNKQKWETPFIIYMALLLGITVFRPWAMSWNHFFQGSLNLKPFAEYARLLKHGELLRALYLFLGNIVVFMPFGMYLKYQKPEMEFLRIVLYGFLLSLAIECMQYVMGTGYTELDDLILNTVGAGVGAKLNKWDKIKFINYVCLGVSVFATIYSYFFFKEPSAEEAMANIQEGQYSWFVKMDCKSFDGRYLATQEDTVSENGYPCVRVDIYNTETDELVDSISIETLWGYQGIMWGKDDYSLFVGLPDGTMLHYRYKGGGWHEVEN